MKKPKAIITITDNDDGTTKISLEFDPPAKNTKPDTNPPCYHTAVQILGVYDMYRELNVENIDTE